MNMQEEIAKTAFELYEQSGCIKGRDCENWLQAEMIVLARHASQDIEEPEELINYEESAEGPSFVSAGGVRQTAARITPAVTPAESEELKETEGIEELEVNLPPPAKETGAPAKGRPEKKAKIAMKPVAKAGKGSVSRKRSGTASHKAK